nr:HesA/MoeB/ThiF family protein [Clostridium aminobutyricum]
MFSTEEIERYSRHILLKGVGTKGQKALLESKVLIIGAGGLGAPAAMYLAAAGVGTIGIVDDDKVELSNLQRQIIHKTGTVGLNKADSAGRTIHEINPGICVKAYPVRITPENIMPVIQEYDFVIDGVDNFPTKFLINDACVIAGKPFSHGGILQFEGQLMTYVPQKGPCYRCIFEGIPPEDAVPSCSQAGVLGAMAGIIGSLQALEALKYILEIGDLLVGRILVFDGLKMTFRTVTYRSASEECKVCGSLPEITDVIKNADQYTQAGCGL